MEQNEIDGFGRAIAMAAKTSPASNPTARDLTVSDKAEVPDVEAFIRDNSYGGGATFGTESEEAVRTLAAQYQEVIDERDAEIALFKSAPFVSALELAEDEIVNGMFTLDARIQQAKAVRLDDEHIARLIAKRSQHEQHMLSIIKLRGLIK